MARSGVFIFLHILILTLGATLFIGVGHGIFLSEVPDQEREVTNSNLRWIYFLGACIPFLYTLISIIEWFIGFSKKLNE